MFKMMKWAGVSVMAVALVLALGSTNAEAGHGCSVGGGGISIGFHSGQRYGSHYGGYSTPHVSHSSGHWGGHVGHGYYHNTSHLDYHAPSLVPHGNHYDYVPGHYDVHQTGHWHH